MRARAAENTGVIVNGAWRGETCCDKQTRRGRGKNTEAPPLRPFLPFSVFFDDGATNLFLVVAHFLVFGRKRNRSAQWRCEGVGSPRGPTCDRSPSSGGVIFTLTGSRSSRGRERERGRFIFLDNTPDSPSSLPIAICPYFCPDHQKGYRRFGGFNP